MRQLISSDSSIILLHYFLILLLVDAASSEADRWLLSRFALKTVQYSFEEAATAHIARVCGDPLL